MPFMRKRGLLIALPFAGGLVAFALMTLLASAPDADGPKPAKEADFIAPPRHAVSSARKTPVVLAVQKALPSVVNIGTERILSRSFSPWGSNGGLDPFDGQLDEFFQRQRDQRSYSLGSGSVIDEENGLVVTNAHVVHRAAKITVTLNDGRNFQAKELAGDYLNDISLLQITKPPSGLKPIETARPYDLLLGESVMAVGNPFGLDSSITYGVVSATARRLTFEGKSLFSDIIQTDAAVYPGNSGGPLINLDGQMIGMNMAFHKDAPGIGFAIPLARIENALAKWLTPERFSNTCLGLIPGMRRGDDGEPEIFVADVIKNSPAEKAGLKKGERITTFQGERFDDLLAFSKRLVRLKTGESASFELADGRSVKIPLRCQVFKDGKSAARDRLDLGLQELTPNLASALGYPFDGGLIVSDMGRESASGVERGDMLVRLGETPIHSWADIARALEGKSYGDKIQAVFISVSVRNGVGFLAKKLVELNVR